MTEHTPNGETRDLLAMERFFHPRGVAVIGVSADRTKAGYRLYEKLRAGFEPHGTVVYPVNPTLTELDGRTVYRSVRDVPNPVDVAVITVTDTESAVRECGTRGIPFALVFAAGFGEVGADGAEREQRLAAAARSVGVRIVGPNTNANFYEEFRQFDGPQIGVVTQSGHQGRAIVAYQDVGYAFAHWAPTGNEVDIEACDFIEFLANQPYVGAIGAYIEGWKSADRLRQVANQAILAGKPIILVKVGRTERGSSYAMSHTAHMTGSDAVFDAFCRQFGVVRVDDLDEVALICGLFTLLPADTRNRVGVYSLSGGTAAHVADLAARYGVVLPPLTDTTQARLREHLPNYLRVDNPVDNGGAVVLGGKNRQILEIMARDPNVDLVVCPMVEALPGQNEILSRDLVAVRDATGTPVAVVWRAPQTDAAHDVLTRARVPVFSSVTRFLESFVRYIEWKDTARNYRTAFAPAHKSDDRPELLFSDRSGTLSEPEAKEILARYGIRAPHEAICTKVDDALAMGDRVGYPLVLKLISRAIPHKTDAGLVSVGITDPEHLSREWRRLQQRGRELAGQPDVEGILVAEQVRGGIEMIVGITHDAQFGPVVLVGSGGVLAELANDVQLGVLPLVPGHAERMVTGLRGAKLLEGWRGAPAADRDALVETVERVAELAHDYGDRIVELEVNPLVVLPRGQGVVALDALAVLSAEPGAVPVPA